MDEVRLNTKSESPLRRRTILLLAYALGTVGAVVGLFFFLPCFFPEAIVRNFHSTTSREALL